MNNPPTNKLNIQKPENNLLYVKNLYNLLLWQGPEKSNWQIYITYDMSKKTPYYFGECPNFLYSAGELMEASESVYEDGKIIKGFRSTFGRVKFPISTGKQTPENFSVPPMEKYSSGKSRKVKAFHVGTVLFLFDTLKGILLAQWRDEQGEPLGWSLEKNSNISPSRRIKAKELLKVDSDFPTDSNLYFSQIFTRLEEISRGLLTIEISL